MTSITIIAETERQWMPDRHDMYCGDADDLGPAKDWLDRVCSNTELSVTCAVLIDGLLALDNTAELEVSGGEDDYHKDAGRILKELGLI